MSSELEESILTGTFSTTISFYSFGKLSYLRGLPPEFYLFGGFFFGEVDFFRVVFLRSAGDEDRDFLALGWGFFAAFLGSDLTNPNSIVCS